MFIFYVIVIQNVSMELLAEMEYKGFSLSLSLSLSLSPSVVRKLMEFIIRDKLVGLVE